MTGRDAVREQLATAYREAAGQPIFPPALNALLAVVDRIANERAAAALEAAADVPLKACCPEHATKRIRSTATALRASNGQGTT